MPRRADCAAIIQSVSSLARDLNMRSVIEGVETSSEQLAILKDKGCDQAQGYYFSEPVPACEVEGLLVRSTESTEQASVGAYRGFFVDNCTSVGERAQIRSEHA